MTYTLQIYTVENYILVSGYITVKPLHSAHCTYVACCREDFYFRSDKQQINHDTARYMTKMLFTDRYTLQNFHYDFFVYLQDAKFVNESFAMCNSR